MPFLSSLADFKPSFNSLNPLNLFTDAPPASPTKSITSLPNKAPSVPAPSPASAVAGPGPTTRSALAARRAANISASTTATADTTATGTTIQQSSPPKSCLRDTSKDGESSSDSLDGLDPQPQPQRRVSGSVTILDPEKGTVHESNRLDVKRRERPVSAGSGFLATRRKRRTPEDNYVIVRPAPSNSNKNAANLQVQLLVGPSRGRERSTSGRSASMTSDQLSPPPSPSKQPLDLPPDQSSSEGETIPATPASETPSIISTATSDDALATTSATLKRSSSLKSSLSGKSSAGSTLSGVSVKRVEPLFNLTVHVMQPTVVTDGATEAKVAKFHKRSIDINGVGILEATEVRLPSSSNLIDETHLAAARSRPLSIVSLTSPISPTMTQSDDGKRGSFDNKRISLDLKNLRMNVNDLAHEASTKKFFGKIFRKRGSQDPPQTHLQPSAMSRKSPASSYASLEPPSPSPDMPHPPVIVKTPSTDIQAGATFGTAPMSVMRRSSGTIISPDGAITGLLARSSLHPEQDNMSTYPLIPSHRPVGYVWTVKRWAKKNAEGWAGHLVAAASAGLELVGGSMGGEEDEVVFEWVKLKYPPGGAPIPGISRRMSTSTSGLPRSLPRVPPSPRSEAQRSYSPSVSKTSLTLPPTKRTASPFPSAPPNPQSQIHHQPSSHLQSSLHTPSQTQPHLPVNTHPHVHMNANVLDSRPEPLRRVSASPSPSHTPDDSRSVAENENASIRSGHTAHTAQTVEEDSDPEESETPWACSVWVKSTGHRQLLATLYPAVHHPRVIAKMKIPMRLDPIALADCKMDPSHTSASTTGRAGAATTGKSQGMMIEQKEMDMEMEKKKEMMDKVKKEVCLSEENLKDVVCVTGMWLVAREGFGGLGRKKGKA
ncbi:hypothetical protein M231_00482 [Tremella mesenterica]|uniref:Uncharacterized protein n=1 Tax=Tremella mesenterica TaxID=5217 RepID=A0A4Q1BVH3_TREME|nr:hypothetical protein M231_00482 [Tremella mesenterica]